MKLVHTCFQHRWARLDTEIARLRSVAAEERQLPRQVALNLELKRAEAARAAALARLRTTRSR